MGRVPVSQILLGGTLGRVNHARDTGWDMPGWLVCNGIRLIYCS